ncbi:hypothetical protein C0J52_07992, partial [Blattella germanica]
NSVLLINQPPTKVIGLFNVDLLVKELVSKGRHRNWRNVAAFVAVGIVVLILVVIGIIFLTGGSENDKHAEAIKSPVPIYGSSISLQDVVEGKFSTKMFNGTMLLRENSAQRCSMERGFQELVSKGRHRNWRNVAAFVAVGIVVLILVVIGIIFLTGGSENDKHAEAIKSPVPIYGSSISLQDVVEGKFSTKMFNGTWISDNEFFYRSEQGDGLLFDAVTKTSKVVVSSDFLFSDQPFSLELSADRKYLLIAHNYRKIFRHSFLANYDIINLETRESIPLENGEKGPENRVHQLVVWAPTGNGFVYVHRNNIYYRPTAGNIAEVQLTRTGIPGIIYHGIPDWVYEEEVFSSNTALWFSPDSKKLAFATFDDNRTRVMSIPFYGVPNNRDFQYTHAVNIRYPKPGTPNPTAGLSVINLEQALIERNFNTYKLETPRSLIASGRDLNEPILSAVTWSSDNDVVAVWMNRIQNEARIQSCDGVAAKCTMLYSISEANGWVDLFNPPLFSQDGSRMLLIHPHEEGESGPYRHVTMIQEGKIIAITSGKFTVTDIVAWDRQNERQMVLETNEDVRQMLEGKTLPTTKRLEVDVPGGFKAQVQLFLPPNLETSGKTKYPLLVNVYGGPDSYQITKKFTIDWSTYLTVNKSIIYAAIDGRGSGLKGNNMQLGNPEIEDQVNVTRYLQKNLNYIDSSRTAIWGWSYGGYATGMALAKDKKDVFKCGISVAPVSDWIYYDTIYTERYMGLPILEDNLKGYEDSALTKIAKHINGKQYLLIHGTLDDNVHYQQSMMLARKLEREDVLFQQMSYPDEEHGLSGVRPHLYHTLGSFLDNCFNLDDRRYNSESK